MIRVDIHLDSQEFFSFFLEGLLFFFLHLTFPPFGWKASAFLYHNVGLVVTSAARSLGVPVSQYIDDRHVGQLFLSGPAVCQPSRQLAQVAAFILLFLLFSAGYFVNLAKSSPQPSTFVEFLGFISDSVLQAFWSHWIKRRKFKALRDKLLDSSFVPVKSLWRFTGKYHLVLQSRLVSCMCGRCSRLSALLPRIRRSLFQSRDLCDRNFRNRFSWTAVLVTY